jgi:riboflavin kinase/FMN adenylyltransferase
MKRIIILGQFDGVHKGHQKVISEAKKYALSKDCKTRVLCFAGNYKKNILGKTAEDLLTTDEEKEILLKEAGISEVSFLPFEDIREMPAKKFIEEIVIKENGGVGVFCGFNYHFGNGGRAGAKEIRGFARDFDIYSHVTDELKILGKDVSSSNIKKYILSGNISLANEFLGRPYFVSGEVVFGNQIGRTLGFPTANMKVQGEKVKPKNGVYASKVLIEGDSKEYLGMTNVGLRPTVKEEKIEPIIETNIFSFNKDIYGKKITVFFTKRIRDEKKFSDLEELKTQIAVDKAACK